MVRFPVHRVHPQTSEVKFLKDGSVNIDEKLTRRLINDDASVIGNAFFVVREHFGKGITFFVSGQKNGNLSMLLGQKPTV
jgi:hypothetical protein